MSWLSWFKRFRLARQRVVIEDALKHLHACEWQGRPATIDSLTGSLSLSQRAAIKLCARMQSQGWLQSAGGELHLTPAGTKLALQIIRAHRLWERYLADEARMPLADIHAEADRLEHQRDSESILALDAAMGHPQSDPHGDPIPTADGDLPNAENMPLTQWPISKPARIVHLEDEPEAVFSQIAAQGLHPGQRIVVLESDDSHVIFADDLETYVLAPIVAANIFVAAAAPIDVQSNIKLLTSLKPGSTATVLKLDESLQGFTRRRLLDLGLTSGVEITAEYSSFLGDPMAYRVRGALIALRRQQAEQVIIKTNNSAGGNGRG